MSIAKQVKTILLAVYNFLYDVCHIRTFFYQKLRQNKLVRKIENTDNEIYLTFDDGPEAGITQFVLEQLKQYSARATFFCCGNAIEKNPRLLEMIKEDGHAIGCHTYTHQRGELADCKEYYQEVTSFCKKYKTKLFRPPYGSISNSELLRLAFRYKIILWSIDSTDWEVEKRDCFDIEQLFSKVTSGSIILFHFSVEHQYRTKQILPLALDYLHKRGFHFNIIK